MSPRRNLTGSTFTFASLMPCVSASASSFRHHSEDAEAGETTAIRKSPSAISVEIARISESPM